MKPNLSAELFQSLVDFNACNQRVQARLDQLINDQSLVRFFVKYASWNGRFANGVAALSSLIGDQCDLFLEAGLPKTVADRSNFVASHFFDAARDEYDDHINPARDTHRCMAQATILAMTEILNLGTGILDEGEGDELNRLNVAVRTGYTGSAVADEGILIQVFFAMGYHLGSELLADREFSIIDSHLRSTRNDLVQDLMRKTITLAGANHRCYTWIGVHSGAIGGGGVEADHFDAAVDGVRQAIKFIRADQIPQSIEAIKRGFMAFANDHEAFFDIET